MRLDFRERPEWPPLAWVARCGPDSVEISGGSMVEAGDGWAFEGAWTGSFEAGEFDRSAVVVGSGAHARSEGVCFVSPTSTVDRLCSVPDRDGRTVISNSLVAALAVAEAQLLEPEGYLSAMRSILRGLGRCVDSLATTNGALRLTYFRNLVWDGRRLERRPKPGTEASFHEFSAYRDFLARGFAGLHANMTSAARSHRLSFLGTLSSGYDANACTTLAVEAGCEAALCFETSAMGYPDSGVPVAEALGIDPLVIDRGSWRTEPAHGFLPEVPFLAAGQGSGGLVEFYGAHRDLRGAVLVTGFYGDSIWNPAWRRLGPNIVRKDASGLALCEYRLWAGFINCPATFWAAREVADVVALSRSEEMQPWRGGGEYERPVPRRILEEAGVPRRIFGQRKRAIPRETPHRQRAFLRAASQRDYFEWLRSNRDVLGRGPRMVSPRLDWLAWWWNDAAFRAHVRSRVLPGWGRSKAWRGRRAKLLARRRKPTRQRRGAVRWALDRAREAYVVAPSDGSERGPASTPAPLDRPERLDVDEVQGATRGMLHRE